MSLRSWWKRLWQPGEPLPEYIVGPVVDGSSPMIYCTNVASVEYWCIGPDGSSYPIFTADGCPLEQHIDQMHVHTTPAELWGFVEVFPVGLIENPDFAASITMGGTTQRDDETAVDTGGQE
jgi:hypothetical protein